MLAYRRREMVQTVRACLPFITDPHACIRGMCEISDLVQWSGVVVPDVADVSGVVMSLLGYTEISGDRFW